MKTSVGVVGPLGVGPALGKPPGSWVRYGGGRVFPRPPTVPDIVPASLRPEWQRRGSRPVMGEGE